MSAPSFEETCARLAQEGYRSREITYSRGKARFFGFLCALPLMAALSVWFFSSPPRFLWPQLWQDFFLFAALFLAAVPLHECLHALVWGLLCGFGSLKVRLSPPSCTCFAEMGRAKYFFGAAAPFLAFGIGFSAAALVTGSWVFFAAAALHFLCAGADLLVCARLLAAKGNIFLDHPQKCGFVCFYR